MRNKLTMAATIFLVAVGLSAQNRSAGINISLWKDVSTQSVDSQQTTYLNLGIFSSMNRQYGFGANAIGSVTAKDMNGVQISGFSNIVGGSMRGLQFSGICNVNGNNLSGLSATGFVNITGNNAKGVLISGITNISGDNTTGFLASGIMNITGNKAKGINLAGLANIAGTTFNGLMAAGLLNVTGESLNGIQLSALANITANKMNGVQLGLGNYATHAKGLQIGLVNYYKESLQGFQLGLVNVNPDTKVQMMVFGGNATKTNIGIRFRNSLFYTIIGAGTHYLDFDDKFSGALFYRGGIWFSLCKNLNFSGDLGYQHIETFKNKNPGFPARLYALQARLNLEYQITQKFGIFATGGYGGSRYYTKNATYDKGVIAEAGIILF